MAPTVAEAEKRAEELLNRGWWTDSLRSSPLPVEPTEVAQRLGIRVRTDSLPADQSGKIEYRHNGSAVITLNAFDHPNRRRFTCAHEIGHYLRRDEDGRDGGYVDYRDTLAGLGVNSEEIYANQFAAALLMPAHLVKRFSSAGESAERMARTFGTSVQAMSLRLRNLRLDQ